MKLAALALALVLALAGATAAPAQDVGERMLRIGTREAPPFSMRTENGTWEGISIELLARVAERLGVRYELVETSLDGMVDQVADGTLDASIAAMTVTREREIRIDFSHPYYRSSLGIAVARSERSGLFRALSALGSPDFLVTVAILLGLLSAVGALAWMAERRANAGQFEPDARRGLFSGFWWAAVTMTTVGYGDKAPVTIRGRILGIVWMFAALVLTALVTAQLAASLTTDRISGRVGQVTDLARVRVGMVAGAASLEPLRDVGARPIPYPDVPSGLRALASGEIEAFVHDEPILVWNERTVEGVAVTPLHFAPQDYAIILPEGAPLREVVNRALLDELASEDWVAIQRRYLGRQQ